MLITIIGTGFIGSHVTEELAKLAFSQEIHDLKFRLIDYDTWEERNAANQNVDLETARSEEPKAITCAKYIKRYGYECESIIDKLVGENANKFLKDSNLIIECLDNIPTRQVLWGFGKGDKPCPVLHTGISRKGDGIINWSSKQFDTFPFRPDILAGREIKEQDIKEPPCEMYKYRSSGLVLVSAIAKAVGFYLGKDPWNILDGAESEGVMSCWNTSPAGARLLTNEEYLIDGFFPIYQK